MSNRQTLLVALIVSGLALAALVTIPLVAQQAAAAPAGQEAFSLIPRHQTASPGYASVSALAFLPVTPGEPYQKDVRRQILSLAGQARPFSADANLFVAPLALPDQSLLTGLAVFGEDFDPQGAIIIRLKRCDHGQARCLTIAETTSTDSYAAGQFETVKVVPLNEVVDNSLYSYLLELELTALLNSGLRSVRLELGNGAGEPPPVGNVEHWSLAGDITNFVIPTIGWSQVRVCTDDLSHLDNPTHYPRLVVDGQTQTLGSNTCVIASGRNIELRRDLNTGPSSGTYQIIR